MRCPRPLVIVLLVLAVSGCQVMERPAEEEVALPPTHAIPPEQGLDGEESAPEDEPPTLSVGDEFWAGEATIAFELSARFLSREARALSLDPAQPVGRTAVREWTLADILVSVDYRGGATRATWRVAGPVEVIGPYVEGMRAGEAEHDALQELGLLPLRVTYWGGSEGGTVVPQ